MLPLEKDPCEGCLVQPICEKMCPEVIDFYSNRVRKRSKQEVEEATGLYWEDDYIDFGNGEVVNIGGSTVPIKKESYIPIQIKIGIIEKFMNFINKGLRNVYRRTKIL